MNLNGTTLNLACGDGRFNEELLNYTNVIAVDIDKNALEALQENTPKNLQTKLHCEIIDFTKTLPYKNEQFDNVFCTGTLHLFKKDELTKILLEVDRVLKRDGKIIFDFAIDIVRYDKNENHVKVVDFEYSYSEAKKFLKSFFNNYEIEIDCHNFEDNNIQNNKDYCKIKGKFLLIYGKKIKNK